MGGTISLFIGFSFWTIVAFICNGFKFGFKWGRKITKEK